jgi:extracellular factor (EF) 3-hydroxypalmitic acid methyl ester biosynthesis protein
MERHVNFIQALVARGGPTPKDYEAFDRWLHDIANEIEVGTVAQEQFDALLSQCGDAFDIATMQGFVRRKPHGYAGDFEIIDRIYRIHTNPDPKLANWDHYFHAQRAPKAVRNRKAYFLDLISTADRLHSRADFRVLNLASGPARDLYEYLSLHSDSRCVFTCVEQDQKAIDYAQQLCRAYLHKIEFHRANVLRFQSTQRYDLVWSAGLFDYLNDKAFRMLLARFFDCIEEGGQIVIGNFAPHNPTKHYMELIGDWRLIYRSADQLAVLALECGIRSDAVQVRHEPEGVNLFLHVTKQGERL